MDMLRNPKFRMIALALFVISIIVLAVLFVPRWLKTEKKDEASEVSATAIADPPPQIVQNDQVLESNLPPSPQVNNPRRVALDECQQGQTLYMNICLDPSEIHSLTNVDHKSKLVAVIAGLPRYQGRQSEIEIAISEFFTSAEENQLKDEQKHKTAVVNVQVTNPSPNTPIQKPNDNGYNHNMTQVQDRGSLKGYNDLIGKEQIQLVKESDSKELEHDMERVYTLASDHSAQVKNSRNKALIAREVVKSLRLAGKTCTDEFRQAEADSFQIDDVSEGMDMQTLLHKGEQLQTAEQLNPRGGGGSGTYFSKRAIQNRSRLNVNTNEEANRALAGQSYDADVAVQDAVRDFKADPQASNTTQELSAFARTL